MKDNLEPTLKTPERLPRYEKGAEEIPKVTKTPEKVESWLKAQPSEELSKESIEKIEKAKDEALNSYPPEKPANRLKNDTPEANRPPALYKPENKISRFLDGVKNLWNKNKNKLLATTTLLGVGMNANSQDSKSMGDMAFANAKENAVKVESIPNDYQKISEGNRVYGVKTTEGVKTTKKLEMAKPGRNDGASEAEYDKFIINKIKEGYTPEELALKKYITPSLIAKYRQLSNPPTIKVVYTETIQIKKEEVNPFSAFAKDGGILYQHDPYGSAGGRVAAEIYIPLRSTSSITDPGHIYAGKYLIRFRDDFKLFDKYAVIDEIEKGRLLGSGGETFQSDELYKELLGKAKSLDQFIKGNDNPNYELSAKDLVDINSNKDLRNKVY